MKKLWIILIVIACVIFVVLFAKDIIIKTSIEKGFELVTGLKLSIGSLNVGILKPVADIKTLRLFNPAQFTDRTMIDMPEIYVNYDLPAIIGGKIHLQEVRLGLKEFVVVKNSKGELNLDALRSVQAYKEGKSPSEKATGKAPQIKIDLLKLNIGKVVYKDYSKGGTPDVKEFNINLSEMYTNIDNPYSLASLIVVRALMGTSVANLANFDLKGLQGTVGGVLSSAQTTITAVGETAKQAAGTATETVKKASDTLKDMFKNHFDSGK